MSPTESAKIRHERERFKTIGINKYAKNQRTIGESKEMYIKQLQLANFKSFAGDDNIFDFSPAINYLVGNNNAGKSTILESLDFLRNGCADPELLRTINSSGSDHFFVQATFAGDLSNFIDHTTVDAKKATTIKNYIYQDSSEDSELLTVRRTFAEQDDYKKIQFLYHSDDKEDEFKNPTGIDAPFKSIYNPTTFRATDTPDSILDFSKTKMLGKLIDRETSGFFESNEWTEFIEAHKRAFSKETGYASNLRSLEEKLNTMTREQFGSDGLSISFDFDTPDVSSFVKQGRTEVKENEDESSKTDIVLKGNGLQRAVAFAVIRAYAETMNEDTSEISDGLFFCIDEPEIWMHPKAQLELAKALSTIAKSEQVWVTTHSPYMLQYFNNSSSNDSHDKASKDNKLYIFEDINSHKHISFKERVKVSSTLGKLQPGQPSLAEITYEAFQIPTTDYHNELFGSLMRELKVSYIDDVDEKLKKSFFLYQATYERFDSRCLKKGNPNRCAITAETLPVHIRNLIDHPESIGKKEEVLKYINENRGNASTFLKKSKDSLSTDMYSIQDIEQQNNQFEPEELEESIQLLLQALQIAKTTKS